MANANANREWTLTESEKDHIAEVMKAWFKEGFCQKELEPSFLGLDWSSFGMRKFSESENDVAFRNPPEFVYFGFSALDAYATAMLAAHFPIASLGELTFSCKLHQYDSEGGLRLQFATKPQRGRIDLGRVMLEVPHSFPVLLGAKGIESGTVLFLVGEGCRMECQYKGRMIAKASPFLQNRPVDLWPEATLTLIPTTELSARAETILAFMNSSATAEGDPN